VSVTVDECNMQPQLIGGHQTMAYLTEAAAAAASVAAVDL